MSRDIDDVLGFDTDTRPKPKRGGGRRRQRLGNLYGVLAKAFPKYVVSKDAEGRPLLDMGRLAEAIRISKQALYKWTKNDKIPANQVFNVVAIADGKVDHADFEPFIG